MSYDYVQAMGVLEHMEKSLGKPGCPTKCKQTTDQIRQIRTLMESFRQRKQNQEKKALEYILQNGEYKLTSGSTSSPDLLIHSNQDLSEQPVFEHALDRYPEVDPATLKENLDIDNKIWLQTEKANLTTKPISILVQISEFAKNSAYELKNDSLGEVIFSYVEKIGPAARYWIYLHDDDIYLTYLDEMGYCSQLCFRKMKYLDTDKSILDLTTFVNTAGYYKITEALGPEIEKIYSKVRFTATDKTERQQILRQCYEYYRIHWMLENGLTINGLIQRLQDTANADDDGGFIKSEQPLMDLLEKWERMETETGKAWMGFRTFENEIFHSKAAMEDLLKENDALLEKWERLKPKIIRSRRN